MNGKFENDNLLLSGLMGDEPEFIPLLSPEDEENFQ